MRTFVFLIYGCIEIGRYLYDAFIHIKLKNSTVHYLQPSYTFYFFVKNIKEIRIKQGANWP